MIKKKEEENNSKESVKNKLYSNNRMKNCKRKNN